MISSIATVVNYEYLFYWRLKLDGTIDFTIKLSGELSTNLLSDGEESPQHGVLVAPGVNAQIHQHMFAARLDMEVDGEENTVSEIDVVPAPMDSANPFGNIFGPVETTLTDDNADNPRVCDSDKARVWKIANAEKTNSITGKPVSYKLVPYTYGPAMPTLLTDAECEVTKKGAFAKGNLWVTPYQKDERYPAGECTPQGDGSGGLPDWTSEGRPLESTDVVLWHCFGVTHVPRVEDFPVMNCEMTGFSLKPDGFFAGNPAIDISPDINEQSKCCSHDD